MNFLAPLEKLLLFVFKLSYQGTNNYGFSLIIMSCVITIGTYPLYYLADVWKQKELDIQALMADDINKIKKSFTGQKRFYLLQTTYRLFHYKSWYAFRTSLGILIQIPFFFAAYNVLSEYTGYCGVSFGIIKDLGKPDGLLFSINLMPVLMTLFNFVSSVIFTKSFKFKDNEQQIILAVVFFLFLYNSPSALLIYWTFNNFLSIFKSLIKLFIHREHISVQTTNLNLHFLYKVSSLIFLFLVLVLLDRGVNVKLFELFLILVNLSVLFISCFRRKSVSREVIFNEILYFIGCTIYVLKIPVVSRFFVIFFITCEGCYTTYKILFPSKNIEIEKKYSYIVLALSTFFIFFILPLYIYFSNYGEFNIPIGITIACSLVITLLACGLNFLILKFIDKGSNNIIKFLLFILVLFFFYTIFLKLDIGLMSEFSFQKDYALYDSKLSIYFIDLITLLFVFYIIDYIVYRKNTFIFPLVSIVCIVFISMTVISFPKEKVTKQVNTINEIKDISYKVNSFSEKSQNVVYIMTDMMNGNYFGRYITEHPEIEKELTGFTWYKDTLSIASATINSLPVMYGGMDYTPDKLNEINLSYIEKVTPGVFQLWNNLLNKGFIASNVYEWDGLNISYEKLADNKNHENYYLQDCRDYVGYYSNKNNLRINNGFEKLYLINILPLFMSTPNSMKKYVYDGSNWNNNKIQINARRNFSLIGMSYMESFSDFASISTTEHPTFHYILGSLTHDSYGISKDLELIENVEDLYDSNLPYYSAAKFLNELVALVRWLKENGVYDNTTIIVCSDHGNAYCDNELCDSFENLNINVYNDLSKCHAMLLIKNKNDDGNFVISNALMQNSDVYEYINEYIFEKDNNFSELQNNPERERCFFACNENMADYKSRKINTFKKYTVNGSMFIQDNWNY